MSTIQNFTDLIAWQKCHLIVIEIYKLTKTFPKDELFGLTSQMRRCSVSVTSNIAEGFSRQTYKDKIQFYSIALGSLTELQNQLIIARDINYIENDAYNKLDGMTLEGHKLINGLIKGAKERIKKKE